MRSSLVTASSRRVWSSMLTCADLTASRTEDSPDDAVGL
jgi:hypothetical protein